MNVIIFSKNRPPQLDLLIRSMHLNFLKDFDATIIYTYTEETYREGYKRLQSEADHRFHWKLEGEGEFRNMVIDALRVPDDYTTLLVDDNVFISKVWKDRIYGCLRSDNVICYSMRLHPKIKTCYAYQGKKVDPPVMKNYTWPWKNASGDYGYPMSCDGHVFRTRDLIKRVENCQFKNPNQFEGELANKPPDRPFMCCDGKPAVIGVPWTKVQTENDNRFVGHNTKAMAILYNKGRVIDYTPFMKMRVDAVHINAPLEWTKR